MEVTQKRLENALIITKDNRVLDPHNVMSKKYTKYFKGYKIKKKMGHLVETKKSYINEALKGNVKKAFPMVTVYQLGGKVKKVR